MSKLKTPRDGANEERSKILKRARKLQNQVNKFIIYIEKRAARTKLTPKGL